MNYGPRTCTTMSIVTGATLVSPDTTKSPAKPSCGFATLSPDKLSKEEKEQLHQRLYADSEDMMYKFQDLFSVTSKSLKDRKVSVAELTQNLTLLGSLKPTYKDSGLPCVS